MTATMMVASNMTKMPQSIAITTMITEFDGLDPQKLIGSIERYARSEGLVRWPEDKRLLLWQEVAPALSGVRLQEDEVAEIEHAVCTWRIG